MRQGKLGLKVGSINIDATRCMPDKERGGSVKRCFGLLGRKREKREKRRRIEKRKEKDETNRKHVMYKGKKEKKDNVKEGTWEGVAEKRTDGLSRQLMSR